MSTASGLAAPPAGPSRGPRVVSLGCRLNLAEGARIERLLGGQEVIVINSCSVTNEAVRQTRQAIRRAARARPDARLLVTGCAVETEQAQIAGMAEVDGLIPNAAKLHPSAWNAPAPDETEPPAIARHTRAFIGVQTGCDHACTFCSIPRARGGSRSLTLAQALRQTERHLASGANEVVLTGVDLTSWGHDLADPLRLGDLVRALLDAFPALPRLRLSSLDGVEIDPLLRELLASEARVMPHVHLSLQHAADLMLKRMRRRHTRAEAAALVAGLKRQRPCIAIGADLIAGFPTETPAHHAQNLALIAELGVVHGHIFAYSPRAGTPAARMPQHPAALIKERAAQLRAAVAKTRSAWLQTLLGQPLSVLVEQDGTGYAPNFAKVAAPAGAVAGSLATIVPRRIEEGLLL